MFKIYIMSYLNAAMEIPILYILFTSGGRLTPSEMAMIVAGVQFISHLFTTLLRYRMAYAILKFRIPLTALGKYIFAASMMVVPYIFFAHPTVISRVFLYIIGGIAIYSAPLLFGSDKFKEYTERDRKSVV